MYIRIPGADSGIEVRGAIDTIRGRGWVQSEALVGPRERSSWINFIGLKTCLPRSHFYYISVIIIGVEFIKLLKIYKL
jgi:hypothetical protein